MNCRADFPGVTEKIHFEVVAFGKKTIIAGFIWSRESAFKAGRQVFFNDSTERVGCEHIINGVVCSLVPSAWFLV